MFNETATTEIYTLSLHDALPISGTGSRAAEVQRRLDRSGVPHLLLQRDRLLYALLPDGPLEAEPLRQDRKSTRLNSSHMSISYAVFCLKKKKNLYHYRTVVYLSQ